MNLAATIAKMRAAGMTSDAIVMALECVVLDAPRPVVDEQAERRRAADRERKRLRNSAESAEMVPPLVPPLEGFPTPLPKTPPYIPPSAEFSLSAGELETELRKAAGWEREPAPNLAVTGPIEALIASGAILETDVLPVVKAHAPRVRRPSSWKYFVPIIQDAVQARIAAGTGPPKAGEVVPFANPTRSHNGPRPNTIAAGFELLERAIEREERALAATQGRNGGREDDPVSLP